MKTTGNVPDFDNLSDLGLVNIDTAHWNLNPEMLSQKTIENKIICTRNVYQNCKNTLTKSWFYRKAR